MTLPPMGGTTEPLNRPLDLLTEMDSLFALWFRIEFCGVIEIELV